nr:reverse transcriptase domain-containing protein [Tanacetum cinerariifolium]
MAQLQEVSPDAAESGPIFDVEPLQKVSNDDYYNVFAIKSAHPEQSKSVHDTYPIKQDAHNVIIDSLDMSYNREEIDQNDDDNDIANEHELLASLIKKLKCEIDESKNHNKFLETSNNRFKEANNKLSETNNLLYTDFKKSKTELARRNSMEYASKMEIKCAQKEAQIKLYKTHKDKELDKVIALENKVNVLDNIVYKPGQSIQTINMLNNKCRTSFAKPEFFEKAQRANTRLYDIGCYNDNLALMLAPESDEDLKAQLQDKGIVISELKKLIEKLKGKYVDTKKDFSKSKSVTQNNVSNDFSKPVTAQTLPLNKKSISKNTNVLTPGMYKLHTEPTQARTSQLLQDSRKINKRMSFSTGVIPTTSVSIPHLKSNPMGDSVMHNNSQGKKQDVEDHRRSAKFSKNKTSVTACNDSLNAKTLNVNFVCATCDKCVLNDKHDMCVLHSVAKPFKKTVASESNQKPRNITRKLYERVTRIWLEKEPPRSILNWDDLVSKFINQIFPPSKTTNLRNEITRFQQRFDESFYEAWDRFNDLLRACPHHGFSELHQLDTFYNSLNINDQDSLNSAAGGNFLDRMPRKCFKIIESKSKVHQSRANAVVAKTRKTNPQLQLILLLLLQLKQLIQIVLLAVVLTRTKIVPLLAKTFIETTSKRSGTLPSNTITNPKEELKGTEVTKDQVQTPSSQSIAPVQPPVVQTESQTPVSGPVVAPVSVPMPNFKSSIPYPSRRDNERRHDQANEQIEKLYEIFKDMSFEISFTNALILMPKFASTLKALIGNKEKLSEMARTPMNEHCSAVILNKLPRKLGDPGKFLIPCEFLGMDECLALADLGASINLMPLSVWEALSLPKLTPTCMTIELADRSVSKPIGIAKDVSVKVGLTSSSRIRISGGRQQVPVIIAKELGDEEKSALIKILMDEDNKPAVQHQRRVNLKIHNVIKKEVEKLLDAGLIYLISDSPWVSPVHCVPKKGGFTVVENEENELIPTRLVSRWQVCTDYRKLNEATRKDHFPLPFMDQMLERLAGNEYYCFLDGFSGYFQIPIDPRD